MAISPNNDFTAGQVLTATECNQFPRGVMATASSTANYVLTTSTVIATGMTVTFTAVASRNYRITYYEPQITTPSLLSGSTDTTIRITNAAGTQLQKSVFQTGAASQIAGSTTNTYVGTLTAGSITIVGCAVTSSTTGAPQLTRGATFPAQLTVEDIGTA